VDAGCDEFVPRSLGAVALCRELAWLIDIVGEITPPIWRLLSGRSFERGRRSSSGSAVRPSCPDRMVSFEVAQQDRLPVLRALAFVTLCVCAVSVKAQSTHSKWWLVHDVQAQLHLTPEQVKDINNIFESTLATRRAQRQELDDLDRELDALLDSATADDRDAATLVTRVEAARARRNVGRMVMLYRMRRILTPDQRRWFDMHSTKSDRGKFTPPIR
jgi:Spy/CpxP family protein refolding chaperone